MRQLEEIIEQIELMQHLQRGWMHRVAAKVAQKVSVLLDDCDVDSLARQQVSQHHSRRTAADDARVGLELFDCHTVSVSQGLDV